MSAETDNDRVRQFTKYAEMLDETSKLELFKILQDKESPDFMARLTKFMGQHETWQ